MEQQISTGIAQVNVKEYCLIWTLANADRLETFDSPRFEVGDVNVIELYLQSYPPECKNGCAKKGFLCIRLLNCTAVLENIQMCAVLSILNKKGKASIVHRRHVTLKPHQEERFFHNFAKKEFLLDERNGLLQNNRLTIQCKIYLEYGIVHHFNPVPAVCDVLYSNTNTRLKEFDDFERLLEDDLYSDVKIIVGNKEFPAHKSILAARSRVFSAMFAHNMKEHLENTVTINDVDPDVMSEVLRFIYTGKASKLESMGKDIFTVADKYVLDGLKVICEEAIAASLTVNNVTETLYFGDYHKSEKIMQSAREFFLTNVKEIIHTENFKTTIEFGGSWVAEVISMLVAKL